MVWVTEDVGVLSLVKTVVCTNPSPPPRGGRCEVSSSFKTSPVIDPQKVKFRLWWLGLCRSIGFPTSESGCSDEKWRLRSSFEVQQNGRCLIPRVLGENPELIKRSHRAFWTPLWYECKWLNKTFLSVSYGYLWSTSLRVPSHNSFPQPRRHGKGLRGGMCLKIHKSIGLRGSWVRKPQKYLRSNTSVLTNLIIINH